METRILTYKVALKVAIVVSLFVAPVSLAAQSGGLRRYEVLFGAGLDNFMGDICSPRSSSSQFWSIPGNTTGLVVNGGIKYNLGRRDECGWVRLDKHNIGFSMFAGTLKASEQDIDTEKYYQRDGIAFKSFFVELSLRYDWYFIGEKPNRFVYKQAGKPQMKKATKTPSYLFAGVGGLLSTGKFYWDDKAAERQNAKFNNVSPVVMGGIGTRFKVRPDVSFGLEAGWRVALGDNIDNCNGKEERTPEKPWVFGKYIDQYQFVTIYATVKLKETKKHLPDFRSIGK